MVTKQCLETHLAPPSTHLGHGARSAAIQAAAKQALSASGALAAVEAAKLGADGQPLEERKKREKKAPKYVKVDMRPINWWPVHRAARDLQEEHEESTHKLFTSMICLPLKSVRMHW